jgi:predicted ATP-dependent endonuclease of OLD family
VTLLDRVTIHGFRGARDVELEPRRLCALVGESSSGQSTVLTAIWMLLDAAAPVPNATDVSHGAKNGRIRFEAESQGRTFFLDARPPATLNLNREGAPPVLFLPAARRGGSELASIASHPRAAKAARLVSSVESVDGGAAVIEAVERLVEARTRGLVVLIEEPELYLSPQAQRHLYRRLRTLADRGNQVFYSTHASSFLSVAHLDELALGRHRSGAGTELRQPGSLPADESFRALAEFDADRAEIFLSRAVLLVEGMTEKLVFPFIFEALGYEPDREAILILETGGKANMPLFARVCNECGVPYVVVHDRDAARGDAPNESERITNRAIAEVAGKGRVVQLAPDFESVIGLKTSNRRSRKPERAYRRFNASRPVPEELADAVERVVTAARGRARGGGGSGKTTTAPQADVAGRSAAPRGARAPRPRARPRRDR